MPHRKWKLYIPVLILAAAVLAWCIYAGSYYRAAPEAMEALESDGEVQVLETDWGWIFDGPSEEKAMVFYPGAKVDAPACAPFLHAQFGNYGLQKGDGTALISAAEQQRQAVEAIVEVVGE